MIENKIKQIIIEKYGSVKRFSDKIEVPYTTIDTILKRGLKNSNVLNVLKMCNELNLDINELANNIIVFRKD
jgi:hypothetical protein